MKIMQTVQLGKTDIKLSPMGIGTWAWGDRIFWAYGQTHSDEDIQGAFDVCVETGFNFYDTASIYGLGHNERVLADLLKRTDKKLIISSKLFPLPWRVTESSILRGIEGSVKRLNYKPIDLYTQHWPIPPLSVETWMRGLARAKSEGLIHAIGSSNLNVSFMNRAVQELEEHDQQLASNQVHFSLLHRAPEFNGILETCHELGITLIAYSPLGQGLLTGKYKPGGRNPKGIMRLSGNKLIEQVQPLIKMLRRIGEDHGDKTPAQVAINWVLCKGAIPIVGAKNARQARENVGALGWELSESEIAQLDETSSRIQVAFPLEYLTGLK
jgi:aryl-alcohol dehydrogenase-like predicted oxidoreductase